MVGWRVYGGLKEGLEGAVVEAAPWWHSCCVGFHVGVMCHTATRKLTQHEKFRVGQRETFSFALEYGLITQANAKSFTLR